MASFLKCQIWRRVQSAPCLPHHSRSLNAPPSPRTNAWTGEIALASQFPLFTHSVPVSYPAYPYILGSLQFALGLALAAGRVSFSAGGEFYEPTRSLIKGKQGEGKGIKQFVKSSRSEHGWQSFIILPNNSILQVRSDQPSFCSISVISLFFKADEHFVPKGKGGHEQFSKYHLITLAFKIAKILVFLDVTLLNSAQCLARMSKDLCSRPDYQLGSVT